MYNIIKLPEYFKRETTQRKVSTAFLSTEAYEQALSEKTPILYIVGNKGTGKSTILNKISTDNSPNALLFYFKEKFQKIEGRAKKALAEKPSSQPYLTYEIEWKNELWDEIVLHLYNNHLKERGVIPVDDGEYLNFHNFIRERHLPINLPITSKIYNVVKRIRKIFFVGGSGGEIDPSSDLDYSGANGINLVKEDVAKVLIEKPLFLMVDEIDKIDSWNSDVRHCIKGLIEAIDSVHREIYQYDAERYDLLIRVAIRRDMLYAASDEYVDEVKINEIDIDNAWNESDLEELVAQQIRLHWGLRSHEVTRGKLLTEIFPPQLVKWDKKPFVYFHLLSGGNPRFLFALLKKSMERSIQRVNILKAESKIGPVLVTSNDINSILKGYSNKSLSEQLNGKKFLLPGLESLKTFVKNKEEFFEKTKTILHEEFFTSLLDYIQEDSELLQKVKSWPRIDTPIEEKVPQALYELNLIAYKSSSKLTYYPMDRPQKGTIIVHPWFQYALLDQKLQVKNDYNPIVELTNAKNDLVTATDRITKLVGSANSTTISESETLEEESYLESNNVLYGIAYVIWCLRHFSKLTFAFADQLPAESRKKLMVFLKVIDEALEKISVVLNTDIEKLHLLAILMNSGSEQINVDQETFEKDILLPENQSVYLECTKNISTWIAGLDGYVTSDMGKILSFVRRQLTEIVLEPITAVK